VKAIVWKIRHIEGGEREDKREQRAEMLKTEMGPEEFYAAFTFVRNAAHRWLITTILQGSGSAIS